MFHENFPEVNFDHYSNFPVFEKHLVVDENGDQHEEFVKLSPDDMRHHISSSVFSDAINGTQLADTSHLDKFQLMDALEYAIDNMSDEQIERMKGLINNGDEKK